jgi:hypothetical protein
VRCERLSSPGRLFVRGQASRRVSVKTPVAANTSVRATGEWAFTGRKSGFVCLGYIQGMTSLVCPRALAVNGLLAFVFALSRTADAQPKGELRGPVALVDVNVVPMDSDRLLPNQTVVASVGRIVAIGPARSARIPNDAKRIDGKGRFLCRALRICMCTSTEEDR